MILKIGEHALVGIELVADHRMADVAEVRADLMLAPGLGPTFDERVLRVMLDGAPLDETRRHDEFEKTVGEVSVWI